MNSSGKHLYLEIMRILACFFVIFNHTGNNGFFLFSQRNWGSMQFWLYMFISVFCKFSVPLFFAISGALLLSQKNESMRKLWFNRIGRIATSLLAFSFIYYVAEIYIGNQVWDIPKFFFQLYDNNWNYSYWYLYAYLQMLITLPFLRTLSKNLDNLYYYYLFVLFFFFNGVLPILQFLLWKDMHSLNGNLKLGWITTNIVFYPLMGYFLQNRVQHIEKKGKLILIMWFFNILTIVMCCIMTYLKAKFVGECTESKSQAFHNSFSMVNAACIFLTIKYFVVKYENKFSEWLKGAIFAMGRCTYGIYLWHVMVLRFLGSQKIWEIFCNYLNINCMISAFLVSLCVMIISFGCTMIMQKIPFLRRLVL